MISVLNRRTEVISFTLAVAAPRFPNENCGAATDRRATKLRNQKDPYYMYFKSNMCTYQDKMMIGAKEVLKEYI